MKDLRALHDLGIDINKGIIPLVGEVGEEMYARLVHCITAISNNKLAYEQLTVILNTYGGDLYQAFAIYDLLKRQPMPIRIVCNGPVMSAGTIILMAADVREISPNSFLMYHYGQEANDTEQSAKQNARLLKLMKNLYKENSSVTTRTLNKWFSQDTYYNADEALKLGLVDEIMENDVKVKKKSTRKTRK